jgi:hypothetical protein
MSNKTRKFWKPPSVREGIVWDKDIFLGPGGPHDPDMVKRLKLKPNREVAGRGTVDEPRVCIGVNDAS